jgi:hypothetical protein
MRSRQPGGCEGMRFVGMNYIEATLAEKPAQEPRSIWSAKDRRRQVNRNAVG